VRITRREEGEGKNSRAGSLCMRGSRDMIIMYSLSLCCRCICSGVLLSDHEGDSRIRWVARWSCHEYSTSIKNTLISVTCTRSNLSLLNN
jgi:hypothetical protein